ncbi:hypothetical protein GYMLUDRAFT_245716 [Collybiopsis luxurians FD-317 M1]|uniref:Uncharacterized protein n=1 Tax=Collybiopsis luxurians FD-317 M1 TaxID=944289 RepID=A0A0D0CKI6_9AGAR|nr:hypothetical protein GYMLUDRAFT_245716 [Collybiopsis luxurians FD-317 M1]
MTIPSFVIIFTSNFHDRTSSLSGPSAKSNTIGSMFENSSSAHKFTPTATSLVPPADLSLDKVCGFAAYPARRNGVLAIGQEDNVHLLWLWRIYLVIPYSMSSLRSGSENSVLYVWATPVSDIAFPVLTFSLAISAFRTPHIAPSLCGYVHFCPTLGVEIWVPEVV